MRVTLTTVGSLGDVRPIVALGAALVDAGHDVRLATHAAYADLARRYGLEHHALPAEPDELLDSDTGQALLGSGRSSLLALRHFARLGDDYIDGIMAESTAASRGADLILSSAAALLVGGLHAGEQLGIPTAGALLQPLHRTREFASFLFPAWTRARLPGRSSYNRLSHAAVQQLAWQLVRRRVDRARRRLGLGPVPRLGPTHELDRADRLWLYGYSPALLPRPADWPASAHVTGYWFLEREQDWRPPDPLRDFLASGPAPVYLGFGSAGRFRRSETTALLQESLRMSSQRGVIGVPGQEPSVRVLSDDVIGVDRVPHAWLFPRMSLVVHHVGLGTVESALRAGRPSVNVPHYLDESFWAARLTHLGVSPRPIPRQQLTASKLADRIRATLADESMRARAGRLQAQVEQEQGSQRAVAAIEAHLAAA
ncbi:MAG: glycosyltransferase [Chloroflexota bacterium]